MKTFCLIFIIVFVSCNQKDTGTTTLKENDTTSIKYAFADLKQLKLSDRHDSISLEILFRNLTDTIYFSRRDQDSGSVGYSLRVLSDMGDTSNFILHLWTMRPDSVVRQADTKFRYHFGRTVRGFVHEYIQRGKLNFYKAYNHDNIRITDTTIVINFKPNDLSKEVVESLKNNICVDASYSWSDAKCESVSWCDYLQNKEVLKSPHRGYIRTHCYADGYVPGPQNDTTIAYAPYDRQ